MVNVYNTNVVSAYNSAVSTYNTDKTAYEKAVSDKKEKPDTTIPSKPAVPTRPGSYTGPSINIADQIADTPKTWDTQIKAMTNAFNPYLQVLNVANTANWNKAAVTKGANRVQYIPAYTGGSAPSNANDHQTVAKSFGQWGIGAGNMIDNASPFIFAQNDASYRPGMMVSVFPHGSVVSANDNRLVIKAHEKTANTVGYSTTSPVAAPAAVADQARVLIASAISAIAVVSTLI